MADTIERLATCARQLLDAAAEIERLRGMHQDMCRVAGNLGDENERLRAALEAVYSEIALGDRLTKIVEAALGDEQTADQER